MVNELQIGSIQVDSPLKNRSVCQHNFCLLIALESRNSTANISPERGSVIDGHCWEWAVGECTEFNIDYNFLPHFYKINRVKQPLC